jgi:4-amino-4-deoxy-L-arabinose transferase-like glycosyltransferase
LVLAGWFAIFPEADWAYYLLSGLNLGVGLYFSFLLASLWLEDTKLAAAPFLLTLIPFYNFLGLKFDQNSILIPLWALTTWAFVLSFRRCHLGYATLAGGAAAAAVLTKYWSIFLVLALVIAALADPRRRIYFRSIAPWATALVGAVLIAPHLAWLMRENFPPLQWMTGDRRAVGSMAVRLWLPVSYLASTLAYTVLAVVLFLWRVHPPAAGWRDMVFPREPQRRMAVLIFWLPMLLPIVVATASQRTLLALWNMPSLGLLPVVLMSSPFVVASRIAAIRIAGFAVTFSLLALLVSPIVAAVKLVTGVENDASYVPAVVGSGRTRMEESNGPSA